MIIISRTKTILRYIKKLFIRLFKLEMKIIYTNYPKYIPKQKNIEMASAKLKGKIEKIHIITENMVVNNEWQANTEKLRKLILDKDDFMDFINWPVVQGTMFHNCSPKELKKLKRSRFWKIYQNVLIEDTVGNPPPYPQFPQSSGSRIHTLYNINELIKAFGPNISLFKTIFEFGGGYGSMYRLIQKLGFSGSYLLYDIPEFSALQEFYLTSLNIYFPNKIFLVSETKKMLSTASTVEPFDLFIAMWSLSESPIELREIVWKAVGDPKFILIAYQSTFGNVDNKKYFTQIKKKRPHYKWVEYEIPHLRGSFYLMGKKN